VRAPAICAFALVFCRTVAAQWLRTRRCSAAGRRVIPLSFHVAIVSPLASQHVPYRRCDPANG
jgi:hypothetical protein